MRRLNLYTTLMRAGRWEEAAQAALSAMPGYPGEALWPMLAARAFAGAGRFARALELADTAEALCAQNDSLQADLADTWLALGLSSLLEQDSETAVKALLRAEALAPGNADIARQLALALQTSHRYQQAALRYAALLASGGGDAQTRHNHIQCLLLSGSLDEAARALSSWPPEPGPERALAAAAVLEAQGEPEAALAALDKIALDEITLDAAPLSRGAPEQNALALRARGRLLHTLGRETEALAAYATALELDPGSEALAGDYAALLMLHGKSREAKSFRDDFRARNGPRPLFEARQALAVPPILADMDEALALRQGMRDLFHKDLPPLGPLSGVMDRPPFYLAFHGLDDRALLMDMADFLLRRTTLSALPGAFPPQGGPAPLRSPGQRRIAFISRHFTNHTVMSYFFRLLRELFPRLPRPWLLEFPQKDNAFRRALAADSRLLTLPARPEAAAGVIAGLDLDILVYLDLGMDSLTWSLAFARLARRQCALYGHPMTTGIPNVDFFLSPGPMEPPDGAKRYSETLLAPPCLLAGFLPPPAPPPGDSPLPSPARQGAVYLCAQSLFKVHPDMDGILRRILEQDSNAEAHFFISARAHETAALQQRFTRSLGPLASRVRWLPQCSEDAFLATLKAADLVLDTPHFSGGGTSFKALGCGIPVLALEGSFMRGRQTAGLYRHLGMRDCIAASPEDYVRMALDLAHSPRKRAQISRELLDRAAALFDFEDSVQALESVLMGEGIG